MRYVIGIDIGTSGTKTVLFDEAGKVVASSTVEYPMYQPQNGYAEQNPADWYNAAVSTIKTVIEKSGVKNTDVVGIGLSGQMHGLVMLDENGEVIRRSIIWCDQRTAREVDEMNQKLGREKLIEITANPALTGWTAAKILWVKNNEPENYERCRHILLPKDYIRYMPAMCSRGCLPQRCPMPVVRSFWMFPVAAGARRSATLWALICPCLQKCTSPAR